MPVDMQTIAKMVGVSRTTVHRALSRSGRISEETRRKILDVARQLDYRPNNLARGLRSQKSATIGIIVTGLNTFYSTILGGAEDLAAENGYSILLARSGGSPAREVEDLDVLREKRVDGIIVAPAHPVRSAPYFKKLLDTGPPFVFIDREVEGIPADSVSTDNFTGGLIVGRHLISIGRTKIAFGCVEDTEMEATSIRERLRGLNAALDEAGLPLVAMIGAGMSAAGSRAAFASAAIESFIRDGGKADAIFAANDATAIGILVKLQRMGIAVPDDVALVGFDGLDISCYVRPALTTVKQPTRQMGEEAVRLLLERISADNGERYSKRILLPPELVVRESCGAKRPGDPSIPLDEEFLE